jgi:2-C-methyl-D-erythritol 4-phosphate cytidylyltransferase
MKEEKKVLLDAEYVRQEIDALMKTPQVQKLIYLQQALQQAVTVPETTDDNNETNQDK